MTSLAPLALDTRSKDTDIHVVGVTGVEGMSVMDFLVAEGFTNVTGHCLCKKDGLERELLENVVLTHPAEKRRLLERVRAWSNRVRSGADYLNVIEEADLVFLPQSWKLYKENVQLLSLKVPRYNIMHLYLELAPCTTIGVTGSDGKTTTTNLIAHLLRAGGRSAEISGNYRQGPQVLSRIKMLDPNGFLVLEISNRHLDFGLTKHPNIAVVTNVTENHLTEHESFEAYVCTKASIIGPETIAVLNKENVQTAKMGKGAKEVHFFEKRLVPFAIANPSLFGEHNLENVAAAYVVGNLVGLTDDELHRAFESFIAVPERLELVGEIHGRLVINNLSGTSAESTRRGVLAFSGRPVSLVMGGDTKGVDYTDFADTLKREGTSVHAVRSEASHALRVLGVHLEEHDTAKDASVAAFQRTPKDGVLLFSPGGAFFESRFLNKKKNPNALSFQEIISLLRSSEPPRDQSQ